MREGEEERGKERRSEGRRKGLSGGAREEEEE